MSICKYCRGTGTISAGYNYLAHDCPDCEGTGQEIKELECWECGDYFYPEEEDQEICFSCKEELEKEGEE